MKVINPFNRVPETKESMAMACRCICNSGQVDMLHTGYYESDCCACQCKTSYNNMNTNDTDAYNGDF